jgi:hypothetical protein
MSNLPPGTTDQMIDNYEINGNCYDDTRYDDWVICGSCFGEMSREYAIYFPEQDCFICNRCLSEMYENGQDVYL